jgi:drug/metabolite transporter (DMT)-like permease
MPSHRVKDWLLLMWGSAFMFQKIALATVPPATAAASRLIIGACVLLAVVYARGLRLPPLTKVWRQYALLALVGNALPFYLIAWGQQAIDSAVAGILIAIMPLATMVLAHYFVRGEHLTRHRAIGFILGFSGIVLLMGPAAFTGMTGSALQVFSQLAVLGGALCYAANTVVAKLSVKGDVLVTSSGVLLFASTMMLPVALALDRPWTIVPSAASMAAVLLLGIGATAIATVCYFVLVRSAGPTFMSLVNYLNPCVALLLGVVIMNEEPGPDAYAGLAMILSGIALSQFRRGVPRAS